MSLRPLGGVLLAKLACDSFALTIQSEDGKLLMSLLASELIDVYTYVYIQFMQVH